MNSVFDSHIDLIDDYKTVDQWEHTIVLCERQNEMDFDLIRKFIELNPHYLIDSRIFVDLGRIILKMRLSRDKLEMLRDYV